eukprot:jgi/Astpho2/1836/Aster-00367
MTDRSGGSQELQPIKETREKQIALWCELILDYCRHQKVYKLSTSAAAEDRLFVNSDISSHALWLDKAHSQCLVLWKRLPEWADIIYTFAQTYGLDDSVMTVDDLSDSEDTANTELQGVPSELLLEAIKLLEGRGKATLFRSQEGEMGVKFFS